MKWCWFRHDWRIVDSSAYETHTSFEAMKLGLGHKIKMTRVLYRCVRCRKFRVEVLDGSWAIVRDGDAEEATLKKIVG